MASTVCCIAGLMISAFGGSRTQIGGPTGAFVVINTDALRRAAAIHNRASPGETRFKAI